MRPGQWSVWYEWMWCVAERQVRGCGWYGGEWRGKEEVEAAQCRQPRSLYDDPMHRTRRIHGARKRSVTGTVSGGWLTAMTA